MKFHVRGIEEDLLAQTLTIANLMIDKVSRLHCSYILNEFLPVALTKKLSEEFSVYSVSKVSVSVQEELAEGVYGVITQSNSFPGHEGFFNRFCDIVLFTKEPNSEL